MEDVSKYPLPALDSPRIQELGWSEHSNPYIAYAGVLQAEQHACQLLTNAAAVQEPKGGHTILSEANGVLISVRVAGYMLLELAAQSGTVGVRPSAQLVEWLMPSPQNSQYDVIVEIGTLLREKFIRACAYLLSLMAAIYLQSLKSELRSRPLHTMIQTHHRPLRSLRVLLPSSH